MEISSFFLTSFPPTPFFFNITQDPFLQRWTPSFLYLPMTRLSFMTDEFPSLVPDNTHPLYHQLYHFGPENQVADIKVRNSMYEELSRRGLKMK